jgi:hypothetical protein
VEIVARDGNCQIFPLNFQYVVQEVFFCNFGCKKISCLIGRSRSGRAGIATGYGAGRPRGGISSPGGDKNFHFFMSSRPAQATQPPIQWVPGALSQGVKRPRREADHSHPASAEVKKTWIYTR